MARPPAATGGHEQTNQTVLNVASAPAQSKADDGGTWVLAGGQPDSAETGLVQIPLDRLLTPPENEVLYRAIRADDPKIVAMAASIRQYGLLQPLTVSADNYVLDGNRRRVACRLAGLDPIPCRVRADLYRGHADFARVLVEFNRQREKSPAERIREEMVSIDPQEAHFALVKHREDAAWGAVSGAPVQVRRARRRSAITAARFPLLDAVLRVLDELAAYLPVSDRQIHYPLLNDPPRIHASKAASLYRNNRASYQVLCDLLTRARLEGLIPFESIADATRPHEPWRTAAGVAEYVAGQVRGFGGGYWRDLLQSQPNHAEVVAEKLTVQTVVQRVAARYTLPVTIMRGFPSLDMRYRLAERYRRSGRERLVLLVLTDYDPDGMEIMHSLGASLTDEFGIASLHMVRVAVTAENIAGLGLQPSMDAKQSSRNFAKFASRHGRHAYELEAIPPPVLEDVLDRAIQANLDMSSFLREQEQERADAAEIAARQRIIARAMATAPEGGPADA